LNPKELYLEIMPFLEKNTGLFMKELWVLLASAAESEVGIPQQILEAKKEELIKEMEEKSRIIVETNHTRRPLSPSCRTRLKSRERKLKLTENPCQFQSPELKDLPQRREIIVV